MVNIIGIIKDNGEAKNVIILNEASPLINKLKETTDSIPPVDTPIKEAASEIIDAIFIKDF